MVCTHSPQQLFLRCGVHGGDFGAHGFGNLHCVQADAATGTNDQHPVRWPDPSQSHEMQCIEAAQGYRCGFSECHVEWLGHDAVGHGQRDVLPIRPEPQACRRKNGVTCLVPADVLSERLDDTREVATENLTPRLSHPECEPQWQPEPFDGEPEAAHLAVGFRRLRRDDPNQDFTFLRYGLGNVPDLQNVRRSVFRVGDRLHVCFQAESERTRLPSAVEQVPRRNGVRGDFNARQCHPGYCPRHLFSVHTFSRFYGVTQKTPGISALECLR